MGPELFLSGKFLSVDGLHRSRVFLPCPHLVCKYKFVLGEGPHVGEI